MTSLWINEYQNWNAFYTPYISHTLRMQNFFCCMRCDTRTGLFNFWNFRCRKRSKKGLLQLWLLRALKNFILRYFQKLMWCYLLVTKNSLLGKVWGKTFFRCEIPWTALIEIASQYIIIEYFVSKPLMLICRALSLFMHVYLS